MLEHTGTIIKIENNTAIVNIEVESACASCHAKTMCTSLDKSIKQIIAQIDNNNFEIGETVNVRIKEITGLKAVVIAYLVPFFILISGLIITLKISNSEVLAGLISIVILIPYYFILFYSRKKINKKFTIYIEKIK